MSYPHRHKACMQRPGIVSPCVLCTQLHCPIVIGTAPVSVVRAHHDQTLRNRSTWSRARLDRPSHANTGYVLGLSPVCHTIPRPGMPCSTPSPSVIRWLQTGSSPSGPSRSKHGNRGVSHHPESHSPYLPRKQPSSPYLTRQPPSSPEVVYARFRATASSNTSDASLPFLRSP